MESLRLGRFYRSAARWPNSAADLVHWAECLKELTEVPLAVIWIPDLGFRIAGLRAGVDPERNGLADFLQSKILDIRARRSRGDETVHLSQVHLGAELEHWRGTESNGEVPAIDQLAILPVASPSKQKFFGWLVFGTQRALPAKVETLVVAAGHHLAFLGALKESEAEVALRDQFLSIASHELKTPLTSIYGVLQLQERMLRTRPGSSHSQEFSQADQEKQRSLFKIVIRQVERLNELIDGLLNVSRIQNGRFMVEPTDADVEALVQEVVNSRLRVIARESGVTIDLETEKVSDVRVDPVRFEEVITNLGMNAIRFSPEGGTVFIRLKREADDVVLSVRDQGPTVPAEDRERIFQPFERAQRTSRLGGLGLGLFISRQIAQLHGGSVAWVEKSVADPGHRNGARSLSGNILEARFPIQQARRQAS